jgi:hypothetical protein
MEGKTLMADSTPSQPLSEGELRVRLTGIISPVSRNENSSLGSSTYQEAVDKVIDLFKAQAVLREGQEAKRDHKFITELIHRLDDSQDDIVDFEGAMGMLKDWQFELANKIHPQEGKKDV